MTKNRRLMKHRVITKEITRFLLLLWSLTIYVGPIKTIIQTYFFFKFIQTEFIQKKKERWMIKLISITKLKVSMRRPWYALQKFTNIIFLPERLPTIYNSLIFFTFSVYVTKVRKPFTNSDQSQTGFTYLQDFRCEHRPRREGLCLEETHLEGPIFLVTAHVHISKGVGKVTDTKDFKVVSNNDKWSKDFLF